MDSISITALAAGAAVISFIYTYMKDQAATAKALGKLEQRVETLEHSHRVLEQLVSTLTETRIAVSRLEQKVDTISNFIHSDNSRSHLV